jgi:heavy metal-binding protein
MRLYRLLPAVLGIVVAIAGTRAVVADEDASLPSLVEHYLPVRAALAADQLDAVKEHADALAGTKDRTLAAAAQALAAAQDIAAARKAFANVSRALIKQVAANEKKKANDRAGLPTLHLFECPMAKPYGKWIQAEREISNPYMGSKMPRCGKRKELLGGGGEPKRLLSDYLAIRTALANDSREGVKEHAQVLTFSMDRNVAAAAKALADEVSMPAIRKAFGDVSRALIEQVQANEKKKKGSVDLPELHLFECPMASPYGRWLQEEPDILNPYKGAAMPRCGKLIATLGGREHAEDGADYVCPMHPGVTANKPSKCSKCGMALREKKD